MMHSAPVGALCALHLGVAATTTCRRCGNFMCSVCAEAGRQPLCPSCQQLADGEFPLSGESDFSSMWGHCVEAWRREIAMLSVAVVIFFALTVGAGVIAGALNQLVATFVDLSTKPLLGPLLVAVVLHQLVGTLVNMVVQGIALVGLYRVLLDVLEGRKADVARMFSQLHLLPRYVALQLIFFIAFTLPIVGTLAGAFVFFVARAGLHWRSFDFEDLRLISLPEVMAFVTALSVVVLVAAVVLLPAFVFSVPELIVGQCTPLEAIVRAWRLGSGQRLRLMGYGMVAVGLVLVGGLLCCVGIIPALPLAYMLLLALFLGLRRSAALPRPA
jgi:hypothetical protein